RSSSCRCRVGPNGPRLEGEPAGVDGPRAVGAADRGEAMDGLMQGKAVVVTGAGRGLGEAFAVHVARAGGAVVVNDVDAELAERTAENIRTHGGRAVASGHNVADAVQAQDLVDLCVKEFGGIDGLVNNAALNYEALPWED